MTTDEPQTPPIPTDGPEIESPEEPMQIGEDARAPRKRRSNQFQSIRNLWIVIGGLAFLLVVSMLSRQVAPRQAAVPADDPEIAAMQADLEVRRSELNRQRAELNLPPLTGRGEDVGAITARLRKDSDTLISLMERYQQLVAEKDRALTEKNVELIRSEQIRESLSAELARAETDMTAPAHLQGELTDALARADRLADELADARRQLAELADNPPSDEIESLKRRLDEANRARDFFEQRANELEASLQNGSGSFSEEGGGFPDEDEE